MDDLFNNMACKLSQDMMEGGALTTSNKMEKQSEQFEKLLDNVSYLSYDRESHMVRFTFKDGSRAFTFLNKEETGIIGINIFKD